MSNSAANAYGWSAVSRSLDNLIASTLPTNSKPISTSTLNSLPSDTLSKKVLAYATHHLPPKTLNHSLRVYLYGQAILNQHFPELLAQPQFLETYYVTCLLHDIGTSEENLDGTKMSFDFYGAIVALETLREFGAEKDMAEAVCEAIIRHQDLGETGTITSLGGIIQLATVFGKPIVFFISLFFLSFLFLKIVKLIVGLQIMSA
jgi:cyanamide hydratase